MSDAQISAYETVTYSPGDDLPLVVELDWSDLSSVLPYSRDSVKVLLGSDEQDVTVYFDTSMEGNVVTVSSREEFKDYLESLPYPVSIMLKVSAESDSKVLSSQLEGTSVVNDVDNNSSTDDTDSTSPKDSWDSVNDNSWGDDYDWGNW